MSPIPASPTVSVITPFYNASQWLPQVIGTTRSQTFGDFEHLLADDASTDRAAEAAQRLVAGDSRYKFLTQPVNAGPSAARNLALSVARGRYIAFLDADDIWLPAKLEVQVRWMRETGHAFSYHDYRFMSHDGKLVGDIVSGPDVLTLKTLHTRRGLGCLTVMIDREQIPSFRFPAFSQRAMHEDFVGWLSVLQAGHTGYRLRYDLARYRLSQTNRSANKLRNALEMWQVLRQTEKVPVARAFLYWISYAWGGFRLHRRARPYIKTDEI